MNDKTMNEADESLSAAGVLNKRMNFILDKLLYGGHHDFAPDFIQQDTTAFEEMASLYETIFFNIDERSMDILDISELDTIVEGNSEAFNEELRMRREGILEDFTNPLILELVSTMDKIQRMGAAATAMQNTFSVMKFMPIFHENMPKLDDDAQDMPQKSHYGLITQKFFDA